MTEASRSLHLRADGWSAVPERLDDGALVRAAIMVAIERIGATLVGYSAHRFSSCGITAAALLAVSDLAVHTRPERAYFAAELAESHLVLHTWPERDYFAADLFFCGPADAEVAVRSLAKSLGAADLQIRRVQRPAS